MLDFHSTETCPACTAVNLVYFGDPTDQSLPDTTGYTCHNCRATIALFTDEWEDEYRPHVAVEGGHDLLVRDGLPRCAAPSASSSAS